MFDTCSLFPLFGDPWPSYLLPSHNHLILCHPLLLLLSIFPSIRVFSNESALRIRQPKYWSFSFKISPSNEHSGLISFRMDWFQDLARVIKSVQYWYREVSQKEKYQYSILIHIYGIQKDGNNDPMCKAAKETQMLRKDFWTLWEKARV